jgi:D-lactate dehydrogenase
LLEGVARIAAELRLLHACYGHAGDGNVHANLLYDPADRAEAERARAGRERVLRLALDLGGTISGEHGVGIAKRPFVPWEQGPLCWTATPPEASLRSLNLPIRQGVSP